MNHALGRWIAGIVLSLLCSGCAASLRPAKEAQIVEPGPGVGAVASVADVRLEARVEAWAWNPRRLDDEVTPVLVKIWNDGRRELRVRYEELALVDIAGRQWSALPPYDTEGSVREPVLAAYGSAGFHIAPHLATHYPYASRYSGAFAFDHGDYAYHHARFATVQLPTTDMLTHALPEGVLDPGGRTAGFVYFERVQDPQDGELALRFELVDAKTQERLGQIEIPFVMD